MLLLTNRGSKGCAGRYGSPETKNGEKEKIRKTRTLISLINGKGEKRFETVYVRYTRYTRNP